MDAPFEVDRHREEPMPKPTPDVTACRLAGARDDFLLAMGELLASVWPRPDRGPVERAEQLKQVARDDDGPDEWAPISFVVRDEDRVIAHALTFCREVRTSAGLTPVLALAKVAADPTRRGEGLGAAVVRAAFTRVDSGVFPVALFQTTVDVRPFYERLGARRVENPIVNSLSVDDPSANPFWDEVVMSYPASVEWPQGPIDLLGPGY